jgi:dihydrofolate reductase
MVGRQLKQGVATMRLSIVCAMDRNALIGVDGHLPWHLPADLARFRKLTWGKPVIMGRKTWFSLPTTPLPNRPNIVLSRTWPGPEGPVRQYGCDVARSMDRAIEAASHYLVGSGRDEAFVIGGAKVFFDAMKHADRIYLTLIDYEFPVDGKAVYFPGGVPTLPDWQTVEEVPGVVDGGNWFWTYRFMVLDRVRVAENGGTDNGD